MHLTDPSPYRTIAAAIRDARAERTTTAPTPRSRDALRRFLERNAPSSEAAQARDKRMQATAAERQAFAPHAGADYFTVTTDGPAFTSTKR